jgi:hypothetical protein
MMKMNRMRCLLFSGLLFSCLPDPARAQTGELRLAAGLLTGLGSGGSPAKPVASASFGFVKSRFSFGPEVSWAFGDERILGVGVVTRLRIGANGLRPYLVGGLGGNYWRRSEFVTAGLFTGSVGAGVSFARRGGTELTLESRVHHNLQNYGGGGTWNFITLAVGGRLGW